VVVKISLKERQERRWWKIYRRGKSGGGEKYLFRRGK
jgi:hypothetical protein